MDAAQEQKMKEWLFGILTEKQKETINKWLNNPEVLVSKKGLIASKIINETLPENNRDAVQVEIKVIHGAFSD